jgi:2-aminoadipate transaminase
MGKSTVMSFDFSKRYDGITGSAIRNIFSLLGDPMIISFAGGNPSPDTFPGEVLSEMAMDILKKDSGTILQYGGTYGRQSFLDVLKELFTEDNAVPQDGEVISLTGSSQGIDLMTKAFIEKGDTILTESPTFLGALQTFRLFEADIVGVEMDDLGMVIDDLEKKIIRYKPKFVYTIPTFQNPTGLTMPASRKKEMVEVCRKYGVLILEDDPYALLRYSGKAEPTIKSFDDGDTVVRLFSFSKIISPGLRVGGAFGNKEIIFKFNLGKQGQDVHTANLNQEMVARYYREGYLYPHIGEINDYYRGKAALMYETATRYMPEGTRVIRPEGGMFLWAELPEQLNATELFSEAVRNKVAYVPGTHFYPDGGHHNTLRLNFTMVSEEKIEKGMKVLGEMFKKQIADK